MFSFLQNSSSSVDAIVRDASFGAKSEMEVPGSSFNDINLDSIAPYRSYLRDFNRPLSYPTLDDEEFCRKLNIVLSLPLILYLMALHETGALNFVRERNVVIISYSICSGFGTPAV